MSNRQRVLALAVLLVAPTALAGETARQILDRRKELEDTTRHWSDRYQKMRFVIRDGRGERERQLEVYERRYGKDDQKAIVFFHAPPEVRGTAFLAFTYKNRPADQWLYLPALKRTRQITAQTRNQRFVGSDLTYNDLDLLAQMPSWTEEDAKSSLRGEESLDGVACHVIELIPRRKDIGYGRIVLWLGRDDLMTRQVELHEGDSGGWLGGMLGNDRSELPKKRIVQRDIRPVGQIPFAHTIEVRSAPTDTSTLVEISEVRFNQGLDDDLFTRRALERGGK
jgi:hypothetical protein